MYVPKHRATHVPAARRRVTTLSTATFGAVALGLTTLGGAPAQAAPVAAVAPVTLAIPTAAPATVVPATAVTTAVRPSAARVRTSAVAAKAVRFAASRKGTPYRFGAAGPRAFDCSGLVKWSYAKAGKKIPRTTKAQYRASKKVSKAAKRPGDLIFYHKGGRVYHVGIYAGNNKVWVARHSGTRITLQKIYSRSYYVGRVA